MERRTEEDKIFKVPIEVILGGKQYLIKPLVIKEARAWRGKLANLFKKLPTYVNATTDDSAGFEVAMNAVLKSLPDETADLFFSYAKDLDREVIEAEATEIELAEAFEAVMIIALPLVRSLTGAMTRLGQ